MTMALDKKNFTALIDSVRSELFTDEEWEEADQIDDFLGTSDSNDMLSQVLEVAYERSPECFEDIQWVNTEYGFPLWVKPGVEWESENSNDDDFDL